jgi:hypothetical protein
MGIEQNKNLLELQDFASECTKKIHYEVPQICVDQNGSKFRVYFVFVDSDYFFDDGTETELVGIPLVGLNEKDKAKIAVRVFDDEKVIDIQSMSNLQERESSITNREGLDWDKLLRDNNKKSVAELLRSANAWGRRMGLLLWYKHMRTYWNEDDSFVSYGELAKHELVNNQHLGVKVGFGDKE